MRIISLTALLLGLALVAGSTLEACGPSDEIDFPGIAQYGVVRGDYFICANDASKIIVVDLKRQRTFDLGPADKKQWHNGDVADGQALFTVKDRLQVIDLNTGKTVREIAIGNGRFNAYGFAGKGQVFIHRGKTVEVFEIATGKTLHTIALGEGDPDGRSGRAWQRVGKRLFLVGPSTTLCVIDLETGKLRDRFAIEARSGIGAIQIEGSLVYCTGARSWVPSDHLACFDMESKKTLFCNLPEELHGSARLASGPYGTAFVIGHDRIDRFTMHGDCCGSFKTSGKEAVLGVWNQRALVAAKNEIRLVEIRETAVTRK